jgi:hypothetical protein
MICSATLLVCTLLLHNLILFFPARAKRSEPFSVYLSSLIWTPTPLHSQQAGAKHARHDLPDVADVRALVSIFKRLRPPPRMSSASLQRPHVRIPATRLRSQALRVCDRQHPGHATAKRATPTTPRPPRKPSCISVRVEQLGPYLTGSSSSPTAPRACIPASRARPSSRLGSRQTAARLSAHV